MEWFRACFAELDDPRTGNAQRHELDEIVMIALLATLCGAEGCVDMALFGRSKESLLRQFLRLPGGIPSHDTFSRVFRLLDPAAFEACFARYLAALAERVQGVVAIDGKTARRSFDRQNGRAPLHLISAWACETRLVLGQLRVDGKSNEIPAVPELLALLAVDGCIVTADAMHAQKTTAQAILEGGGDYVLALKANRPALLADVRLLLDDPAAGSQGRPPVVAPERRAPPDEVAITTDGDHGRIETRRAEIVHDVAWLAETHGFPGLKAIGKVTATREQDGRAATATRYYLLSRRLTAARFLEVVRTHWQIENCLHWVLDVVLDEDRARARKDHAPENLARLRRFALNVLRANRNQGSTRGKIKRAGWDDAFLLSLLASA
jgi:predicted transposase YbfD/YdcC